MFFYNNLGANVGTLRQNKSGHGFPYAYDSVGDMLNFVLTNLKSGKISKLQPKDVNWRQKGVLRKFSQIDFVDSTMWQDSGLAAYGHVYYPY